MQRPRPGFFVSNCRAFLWTQTNDIHVKSIKNEKWPNVSKIVSRLEKTYTSIQWTFHGSTVIVLYWITTKTKITETEIRKHSRFYSLIIKEHKLPLPTYQLDTICYQKRRSEHYFRIQNCSQTKKKQHVQHNKPNTSRIFFFFLNQYDL